MSKPLMTSHLELASNPSSLAVCLEGVGTAGDSLALQDNCLILPINQFLSIAIVIEIPINQASSSHLLQLVLALQNKLDSDHELVNRFSCCNCNCFCANLLENSSRDFFSFNSHGGIKSSYV